MTDKATQILIALSDYEHETATAEHIFERNGQVTSKAYRFHVRETQRAARSFRRLTEDE